jgi:hypothetical protein
MRPPVKRLFQVLKIKNALSFPFLFAPLYA